MMFRLEDKLLQVNIKTNDIRKHNYFGFPFLIDCPKKYQHLGIIPAVGGGHAAGGRPAIFREFSHMVCTKLAFFYGRFQFLNVFDWCSGCYWLDRTQKNSMALWWIIDNQYFCINSCSLHISK
jgi:hypothetical protein